MSIAKIYELGDERGTITEFAEACLVDRDIMKGRIIRHLRGKIGLEDVFVSGPIETWGKNGNESWRALPDPINGRPANLAKIKQTTRLDEIYGGEDEAGWSPSTSGTPAGDY